jgi:hypothetical protein
MNKFNIFRNGHVYVMAKQCSTCIYRRDSLTPRKRVKQMQTQAIAEQTAIVCHHTIGTRSNAVCRGFFNRYAMDVFALHLADAVGILRYKKGK